MNSRWAFVFATALAALAQDPRQVIEESQRRLHSDSQRYEGVLEVVGSGSRISKKSWQSERIGSYGASKAILRFTGPPEVKGVALLVINHPDRSSDQWMWTPALERDRRIALQDRSTRFFGTDFSFEDLEERDAGQFDFRMLPAEEMEGAACWHIEATPKRSKVSQYTSSQVWVRKDNYVAVRFDNYAKDAVIRRMYQRDIRRVQGIWSPTLIEITDLRRNSRTILKMEKLEYNVPLKEESFTVQALRNGG